ncbi:conserved hypothetical protein [delta proteobacterium NaphS2]|nr:conserved hypothetical protein [delta proteobacterium NaphS2]
MKGEAQYAPRILFFLRDILSHAGPSFSNHGPFWIGVKASYSGSLSRFKMHYFDHKNESIPLWTNRLICLKLFIKNAFTNEPGEKGEMKMKDLKNLLKMGGVLIVSAFMAAAMAGCATTAQLDAVQAQVNQAMDKANMAMEEARSAKAMVSDESQKSEAAALKAEEAAARAEESAMRAERAAEKTEAIFMKKMKK